jgi:hypothetical protein
MPSFRQNREAKRAAEVSGRAIPAGGATQLERRPSGCIDQNVRRRNPSRLLSASDERRAALSITALALVQLSADSSENLKAHPAMVAIPLQDGKSRNVKFPKPKADGGAEASAIY